MPKVWFPGLFNDVVARFGSAIDVEALFSAPLLPLIAAPFIGSFAGVLIERLPAGRPVAVARSECDSCGTVLRPWDMVPLVSFVMLRGRCRFCHARIGAIHPLVELAALAVAGWATSADAGAGRIWADCLLGWCLLALVWIDFRHMRLPDVLTLPLVVLGLLFTSILEPTALASHAAGAVAGYVLLRTISWVYRALRGREGLGAGDAKLLAAAGAWAGLEALPLILLLAATGGIFLAVGQAWAAGDLRRLGGSTAIAFGPPLAMAIWLARLYWQPAF